MLKVGDKAVAGMAEAMPDVPADVPPHWTPYFGVEDADASAEKVKELGGSVIFGPADIPNVGRFAMVADDQGASFSIMKGGSNAPAEAG